jgi:hypothetical protein
MALADAERRGLAALKPLLEALARSVEAVRAADWNDRADDTLATEAHRHKEQDS